MQEAAQLDREDQAKTRLKIVDCDIHPSLHRREDLYDFTQAIDWSRSITPLQTLAVDAAVKSTPVILTEVRLGDDLGDHALAIDRVDVH